MKSSHSFKLALLFVSPLVYAAIGLGLLALLVQTFWPQNRVNLPTLLAVLTVGYVSWFLADGRHKLKRIQHISAEQFKKPINLRQPTWEYLLHKLGKSRPAEELSAHPAKYLLQAGIEHAPDLLADTIVVLGGDVEYKITPEAAQAISRGDELIVLRRLDGQNTSIARARLIDALKHDCEFDQINQRA